jgi:hypothetical protein
MNAAGGGTDRRRLAAIHGSTFHSKTHITEQPMPGAAIDDNSRLALRVRAEGKAERMRAAALTHTDMSDFVLRHALDATRGRATTRAAPRPSWPCRRELNDGC